MLCLQLGTVFISGIVVFVSGMLAEAALVKWWLRRDIAKSKSTKP